MQPHHRASHIPHTRMQPIALRKVDCSHADSSAAVVATVVLSNPVAPVLACLPGTVLVETNVDQEVAVFKVRLEIRGRLVGRPTLDVWTEITGAVPALELAGAFGFIIQRGSQGDDTGDLYIRLSKGCSRIMRINCIPSPALAVPSAP